MIYYLSRDRIVPVRTFFRYVSLLGKFKRSVRKPANNKCDGRLLMDDVAMVLLWGQERKTKYSAILRVFRAADGNFEYMKTPREWFLAT